MAPTATSIEDLLRDLAPQVLGALVRRYGRFDIAEDAVQDALLVAATQWPVDGLPDEPRPWLIRVASRKMIDKLRSDQARRRREEIDAATMPVDRSVNHGTLHAADDSLVLLFLCCHPALSRPSQIALTLRAVGGLSTGEIARALLVPEATMGQRISRAKQAIKSAGAVFGPPGTSERGVRLEAVLQVIYLIFNEGHTSSSGVHISRVELSTEAIRLGRMLQRVLPGDGEVAGLLALMLLTDARRAARTDARGALVPMADQDRRLWDRAAITEGVALLTEAMSRNPPGPYQIQAAIAAVHGEAQLADDTDWNQILALYVLLERMTDNPLVALNRAVATAMAHGPHAGLDIVDILDTDERIAGHHRLATVRAHLTEMAGDAETAATQFEAAARRSTNTAEQRYLRTKAAELRRSSGRA